LRRVWTKDVDCRLCIRVTKIIRHEWKSQAKRLFLFENKSINNVDSGYRLVLFQHCSFLLTSFSQILSSIVLLSQMIYAVADKLWQPYLSIKPKTKQMYEGSAANVILDGCPGS